MTQAIPKVVLPGQPIVPILSGKKNAKYFAGKNCRIETIRYNGSEIPSIVSSVVGKVKVYKTEKGDDDKKAENSELDEYTVDVVSKHDPEFTEGSTEIHYGVKFASATPKLNDIVLARVMKISNNRVNVEILSIDTNNSASTEKELMMANLATNENGENFKGMIRSLDIRSTERDKVKTWECFQPGDIIRAEIISLGDGINYYLSTARNDLGVVLARSASGEMMYALDWETMVVPKTGDLENRKCAKPF
ncbi:DEKNAAC101665 [Brettanomyces naardenensis]|uniref:DEKNAAC101665 n=1 Tax=Brettanomyces naardenensis TaxID=13370 RepID=A0A448YIP6_BRENA|nr:DEKNAAC101665 [Brettanomyces naardenensis]